VAGQVSSAGIGNYGVENKHNLYIKFHYLLLFIFYYSLKMAVAIV